jgi:hypothetical protein
VDHDAPGRAWAERQVGYAQPCGQRVAVGDTRRRQLSLRGQQRKPLDRLREPEVARTVVGDEPDQAGHTNCSSM